MKNLHFTTVLNVQRTRSDERYVSRRGLPNLPCGKKRIDFKEEQPSSQQPFSAALLSSSSQQLFSAAFLQHCSSAFSAAFLSTSSQQLFSAALLSSFSQQLFSAAFLSSSSQQPFSAAILSYHLAVVRGWRPAINIILQWSGVGGQLLTSSCCGQGLVVSYEHVLWKNPFATLSGKINFLMFPIPWRHILDW